MQFTISPAQVEEVVESGLLAQLDAELLARYPLASPYTTLSQMSFAPRTGTS